MRKLFKWIGIIILALMAISVISYTFFTTDEEKFEMKVNSASQNISTAESIDELNTIYSEIDSLKILDKSGNLTSLFDSLYQLRADAEQKVIEKERSGRFYYAYTTAQELIKSQLKAPSTAEFCKWDDVKRTYFENDTYRVQLWVDAQNSFGAMIRETYQVDLKPNGDSWNLVDIVKVN